MRAICCLHRSGVFGLVRPKLHQKARPKRTRLLGIGASKLELSYWQVNVLGRYQSVTISARLNGTFVEPMAELIPRFGLPAHQIKATIKPHQPIRRLARTAAEKIKLERNINDMLSDPALR